MNKKGLATLLVWQKAKELAVLICKEVLPLLPVEEKYALAQQLRRSAQSIPANIAEAYGRYSFPDSIRFMYIARGSIEEIYSHLMLIKELGYIEAELLIECLNLYNETIKLINGYITYLKQSGKGKDFNVSEESAIYVGDGYATDEIA